ncbi:MAG: hypothetical protein ACK55S_17925 [Planctomycetota bacterium]
MHLRPSSGGTPFVQVAMLEHDLTTGRDGQVFHVTAIGVFR